jgi:hypothetical protein
MTAPNGFDLNSLSVDPWSGVGIVIQGGGVYYYDFADQAPVVVPYRWVSKINQFNAKRNFQAMRIFFSIPPGTPAQNPVRNTASVQTLAADQYGIVRVYANEVLVSTREIRANGELLRIPSGFKAEEWLFEFEGRVVISNAQIATSVKELAGV